MADQRHFIQAGLMTAGLHFGKALGLPVPGPQKGQG